MLDLVAGATRTPHTREVRFRLHPSSAIVYSMTGWTSPTHILLLLLIALLLFGAKRLPEIGRSLGTGMREFKDSVTSDSTPEPTQSSQLPAETRSTTAATLLAENETVR